MVLISLMFCFFDNRNIDILRTGAEEGEAAKFIAAYKSPDYTDRSKADEKKEVTEDEREEKLEKLSVAFLKLKVKFLRISVS